MSRWDRDALTLTKRAPNTKVLRWGAFMTLAPVGDEDRVTPDAAGQERLTRNTIATIATSAFPNITRGATIFVDGEAHTVRDFRPIDDGVLTELFLVEHVP